ncbi:hypothetical protein LTS18_013672, partial [Coniosporium uncinatum]
AGADSKKLKLSKAQRQGAEETQETAAVHLAQLIPRLLKKFGEQPEAASAVLRLEHVLNLDIFQQLRQDNTTYATLLDDINKQFMSHGDQKVLAEASAALLHAKSFDDLGEITEGRLQALWEDTTATLHKLTSTHEDTRSVRGGFSDNILKAVSDTVLRLSNLSSITDPTEFLEAAPRSTPAKSKKGKGRSQKAASGQIPNAVAVLNDLILRGIPSRDTDADQDAREDQIVSNASQCLLFYFMWLVRSWQNRIASGNNIPDDALDACASRRDTFVANLTKVMESRRGTDDLRAQIAGTLLDLHTLFTTLRQAKPKRRPANAAKVNEDYLAMVLEVEPPTQTILLQILTAAEKSLAKKLKKNLEDVAEDDEPLDPDDEPESDDDDEPDAADEAAMAERQRELLKSERLLCEFAGKLVLGVLAGVLDAPTEDEGETRKEGPGPVSKRLQRNKARLGPNFKEVVAYLDQDKREGKGKGRAKM